MKRFILTTLLFLGFGLSAAEYTIDPAHSTVGFSVKHLSISTVRGTFSDFTGNLEFDETKKQLTSGKGSVKAKTIDTANEKRDEHLQSADFFDVKKFPEITFEVKSSKTAGNKITVNGDLTMHGVTKPIILNGEFLGAAKDGYGNYKIGFSVSGKINRKDFGLTWNAPVETGGVLVSEEVALNLELQAVKK
jgi:polyisoprenoid-binding protein YceI